MVVGSGVNGWVGGGFWGGGQVAVDSDDFCLKQ